MSKDVQVTQPTAQEFLEAAYTQLNCQEGALFDSVNTSQVDIGQSHTQID